MLLSSGNLLVPFPIYGIQFWDLSLVRLFEGEDKAAPIHPSLRRNFETSGTIITSHYQSGGSKVILMVLVESLNQKKSPETSRRPQPHPIGMAKIERTTSDQ